MPYEPKYTITHEILNNISRIESSRAIIVNSPLIPAWERRFQKEALFRAVHYSTHIENNPLLYKEVSLIMHGKLKSDDVRVRDYKEVVNYREVLKYLDKEIARKGKLKLDSDLLLKIHSIISEGLIPPKYCGVYRNVPVVLVNSQTRKISYRAPESKFVFGLVKDLFNWYNKNDNRVHPVIKSGILHTQIARIHPFVEANGRTARVVATLSLLLDDYDIKRFFCLDEHYDSDLDRYYGALQSVEEAKGDMTDWLEYFSDGLAEELERIKERVMGLSHDIKLRKKIGQVALTDRQVKILSFIQNHGYINNKEWRIILHKFSDDTVLRDLKVLMKRGLIKKTGKTKSARYVLRD